MEVYISGPISGYQVPIAKGNFDRAETLWTERGWTVYNPMEVDHGEHGRLLNGAAHPTDEEWLAFILRDIKAVAECRILYLLEGWELSNGARIEFEVATRLRKLIVREGQEEQEEGVLV